MGSPTTERTYDGSVQIVLFINQIEYGPYTTGIFTYRSIWDGRKAARVSQESRNLTDELGAYKTLLDEAHGQLEKRGGVIDGQAIINAVLWMQQQGRLPADDMLSPLEIITLPRVYQEFMDFKESCIEPDRRKRTIEQISPATFDTYPKRWVLILGYLGHINRSKYPVINVTYAFTTNLKEWLIKQRKMDGTPYDVATINKVIALLKQPTIYALSKGYIDNNSVRDFACRGGSAANPKPLTRDQLDHLETCYLPPMLRRICDSWLVAAELCLHYADFMELPTMKIIQRPGGIRLIQHDRAKQTGSKLLQTVNITARAERLIEKWGGIRRLYYRSSALYSKALKRIAMHADLRDADEHLIGLQFGQGRDTGLTLRAIDGANNTQLSKMGGWSKAAYADRYIGLAEEIVEGFVKSVESRSEPDDPQT